MKSEYHYLKVELYDRIQRDESIFEFIQAGSLDGIWYWDLEKPENEWMSPTFWTTLGYDPKGKKHLCSEWQDLIHPGDLQLAISNFEKHCQDPNHPYDQVVRYRHKNGTTVWVRCRGVAIRNKDGKPIRMLGAHTNLTYQKRVEQELRESQAKYKLLAEFTADVIYKVDIQTERFTYLSPSVENMFGFTVKEGMSFTIQDALTEASYQKQQQRLLDSIGSKQYVSDIIELEVIHKDGHIVPVEVHSSFIFNDMGQPVEILGVARDMTRRKAAEALNRKLNQLHCNLLLSGELEDKLKLITDSVVDIFDADFARIWITRKGDLCTAGCIHADALNGLNLCRFRDKCLHLVASSGRYSDIHGGHRRVPFGCYKIGRIASEEDSKFLTNDVAQDPRVHDQQWVKRLGLQSFAGYKLQSESGKTIGVLALFSKHRIDYDISSLIEGLAYTTSQVIQTALKEEVVRESEQRFRDLTESTSDWVWEVNLSGEYTYASPKVKELLGYSPEEVIGKTPFDFMPPEEAKRVAEVFQRVVASQGQFDFLENINIHKQGQMVTLETSGVPRFDAKGQLIGYRGIDRDVTKRKKAAEALADSEKRLSDIIEFLPDPTWVIDLDGKVIAWNRAIEKITGVDKQNMLGKGAYAYSVPLYGQPRPVLIDLVLQRDQRWEAEYLSLTESDGILISSESYHPKMGDKGIYLAATAGRLYNAAGKVVGAIETLRDITASKKLEQEREGLISELQDALAKVRTLSGMLPICASCKKIRDDKGYWNQIESYISKHSQAEFSHGICPQCARKLYPDLKIKLD